MLNTEHLCSFYRYRQKADQQFQKIVEQVNDLLETLEVNLIFPVNIEEKNHQAYWDYVSIIPEDAKSDYDDEEEDSYLFHKIYVGLTVTAKHLHDIGGTRPFLTLSVGAMRGENQVTFFHYALDDALDIEKITSDIATTVSTLRELETLISNMTPERGEIVQKLLVTLLDW